MGNLFSCKQREKLKVSEESKYFTENYREYYVNVINYVISIIDNNYNNKHISFIEFFILCFINHGTEPLEEFASISEERLDLIRKELKISCFINDYPFDILTTHELHCIYVFLSNKYYNTDYSNFNCRGENNEFCIDILGDNNTNCINSKCINNCIKCYESNKCDNCNDCINCYGCNNLTHCVHCVYIDNVDNYVDNKYTEDINISYTINKNNCIQFDQN